MHEILQPEGWARPVGYSNGMAARGRIIVTGGQIGWNAQCQFEPDDLLAQIGQTLANIAAILKEAGAGPEHIISMTWYLTDLAEYRAIRQQMGPAYRAVKPVRPRRRQPRLSSTRATASSRRPTAPRISTRPPGPSRRTPRRA